MYEFFTEEHQKYINVLGSNTDITTKSSTLSQNCSSAITSINSTFFSMVENSNWEELAKSTVINSILPGLNSSLQELSDFITNNLVTVCSLAIGSLLETCKQIMEKQKELDTTITSLNSKENSKPEKEEDIPGWEAECKALQNKRDTLVLTLTELCEKVEKIKETIESLNSGLSAMEVNSLLSNLNSDGVIEVYPDLVALLGLGDNYIIEGQIPIRFNMDTLYTLLEGNAYRDIIMEYLSQYGKTDFDITDIYNEYVEKGLLPEWKSTEYSNNSLFNFMAHNLNVYNEEAKDAMITVLNHTIYETMLPYYQDGTLDLYKDIQVRSLIYCSDFLVKFDYTSSFPENREKYIYSTDASGFVNMGGGTCHLYADGVLMQAMNDFASDYKLVESYDEAGNLVVTSPLTITKYDADGNILDTDRNHDGAYYELFSASAVAGAEQYSKKGENTKGWDGAVIGAPTALYVPGAKNFHVIIPQYEVSVINEKTGQSTRMYITAESTGGKGFVLQLRDERKTKQHNWTITENVLDGLDSLSYNPDSFMFNYESVNN